MLKHILLVSHGWRIETGSDLRFEAHEESPELKKQIRRLPPA